jgi:hypothetical protein
MFAAVCILYTYFRGSPAGEANKTRFFLKNYYVHRFPEEHKSHVG